MKEIRKCLNDFNFRELFTQHLLWEGYRTKHAFEVSGQFFEVEGVAEKRGLVVFICRPAPNQPFPGSAERKRIGREIEKLHHEHLIIFIDREQTRQIWSVPKREDGKSKGTSEIPFYKGNGVEHLARRIRKISFSLEESETTTIVQVAARVNQALLAERVTKKFFKEFSDQRKAFVKFLDWIEDESKRDWYCSVLLNRLMFIYFLGGKGFLPAGTGFLSNNLESNKTQNGADTFYTHFLLPLSFFGLGEKRGKRERFEDQFKDVIYLNGGLFAVHSVERELGIDKAAVLAAKFDAKTKIPDSEFQKWFAYFDKWRWTLDEDKVENEGYISPHILGYIFEKYINQKQMGAYYTKEDITGYICRNTIIPRLFDMLAETGEKGKKSVRPLPVGPHPNLFNDGRGISDGEGIDRYVYPSVKQENKLPTETDYEQEQRRKRYESILTDFDNDKIHSIDDFITYNLDIERLALDFISNIQDPEVLHAFYFKGLQQITVLDPTCGSGAFLFEALIVMYPLYNACLSRMRYLVGKGTGTEPEIVNWGGRLHFDDLDIDQSTFADVIPTGGGSSKVLNDLRTEVERINDHPSAEYFIKKSIIVNNLFGVDIMEEAVEICKLRLFLTLIATVERDDSKANFGVEPLPDIDFNILAGNTLVGYTSIEDIDRLWHEVEMGSATLAFEKDHSRLKVLVEEYGKVLKTWRLQQLGEWRGAPISKEQVLKAVESIRPELNEDLWRLYRTAGLATKKLKTAGGTDKTVELTLAAFVKSHEPFHWLLEFPSIEAVGGFDCIVGNPPYVETTKTHEHYRLVGFETQSCGNLYAHCIERSIAITCPGGFVAMIVQLPVACSPRMAPCLTLMRDTSDASWFAFFDDRPARLFDGLEHIRATIFNLRLGVDGNKTFSTRYQKWYSDQRHTLFESITFLDSTRHVIHGFVPKDGDKLAQSIREKLAEHPLMSNFLCNHGHTIYYHNAPQYWMRFMDFVPYFYNERDGIGRSLQLKTLTYSDSTLASAACALLNSSLFYWYFCTLSDCRHLNLADIARMRCDMVALATFDSKYLQQLVSRLMTSLKANSVRKDTIYKTTGRVIYDEFRPRLSVKEYFEIDDFVFDFYQFTEEEKNFLRNYDRRFRLGADISEEE